MISNFLTTQQLIYLLTFSSLLFAIAAFYRRRRLLGKTRLLERLIGDDYRIIDLEKDDTREKKRRFQLNNLFPKIYIKSIATKLSNAGQVGQEYLNGFLKRKFLFALGFLLISSLYFLPSDQISRIFIATLAGFFLPDLLLTNTIQKRAETIENSLPDAVEMLTMCVEAGLSFQQALKRVSENQKSVISAEFARIMSEIQIGEPRVSALRKMGERLNHPDVSKFVSAMMQVDRLGIPISSVLREQVQELRSRSRMRAREKAQKVPVKILGPVMVCFMPCTLIIVLGPVILQFMG